MYNKGNNKQNIQRAYGGRKCFPTKAKTPKYTNSSQNSITRTRKKPNQKMIRKKKKWLEDRLQRRHTDGQQACEKCSTSLIIREMKIKTIMRYYLTLVRTAIIKKSINIKCCKGYEEKGTILHPGGNVSWYSHYGEQYRSSSEN